MTAPSTTAGGPVLRRLSRPFAALAATALPTAYIAAVDPNTPGHYPLCPFRQATGWWCPGCGGLRCVHALAHGEFTAGLHDNLLAVVLFVVLGVLWVRWAFAALTGGPGPRVAMGPARLVALGLVLVAFTVLRNLPAGVHLAPSAV